MFHTENAAKIHVYSSNLAKSEPKRKSQTRKRKSQINFNNKIKTAHFNPVNLQKMSSIFFEFEILDII